MPLAPGTRLGPYEIVAPIGAGGMGEVYRARDAKLEREIAVKVLPAHLAQHPDALARFEREAKAVAALSHPNILAIHDFGHEAGTAYAAMELLDGETLRGRLADGPLPPRRAVEWAQQIVQALAAAHAKGIVHRDLKPENIFITSDGRVKVLDFGLAKLSEGGGPGFGSDTRSPTLAQVTEQGTVMGTAGYMSPEAVRAQPVDARSDIFSFGAVLYEMLSGRRAFAADTAAETMTAILREEPPELARLVKDLPPALARIVTHCLEKRPEERYQSTRDLAFELGNQTTDSHARLEPPAAASSSNGRLSRAVIVGGVLVALAATLGATVGRWTARPSADFAAGRSAASGSFVQLSDQPGVETEPVISPDGKSFVFVSDAGGNTDLFLARIGGRNSIDLTADSSADDHQPSFSPDGERIAFRSERDGGGIFVMGSTGESAKRLSDFGYWPSWSPDGTQIVVCMGKFLSPSDRETGGKELWAIDVATGTKRPVIGGSDALQPQWSPHGQRIAYWGLRGTSGQRDIWTVAADGSEATSTGVDVTNDAALDWSPAWSPDGRALYFSSTRGGTMNLWRVSIDETSGRVLGPPQPVTTPSAWSGYASLSRDGRKLAYATLDWRSTLLKLAFDPKSGKTSGAPTPILRSTKPIRDHDVSPDGRWVAFAETGVQEDLFISSMDGTQYRRLTDDAFRDRAPVWSPDASRLAFYSDRGGAYQTWSIHPDGSALTALTPAKYSSNFPTWSPDGSRLAISAGSGNWRVFELSDLENAREMPQVSATDLFWAFSWSRDGKKVAGAGLGTEGGLGEIGYYSFDTQRYEMTRFSGNASWVVPAWLSDGRRMIVRDHRGIFLVDSESWRSELLYAVGGYSVGRSVGVTRDDRWITFTETATEGDVWLMNLE